LEEVPTIDDIDNELLALPVTHDALSGRKGRALRTLSGMGIGRWRREALGVAQHRAYGLPKLFLYGETVTAELLRLQLPSSGPDEKLVSNASRWWATVGSCPAIHQLVSGKAATCGDLQLQFCLPCHRSALARRFDAVGIRSIEANRLDDL
jgi:hypothetical protein